MEFPRDFLVWDFLDFSLIARNAEDTEYNKKYLIPLYRLPASRNPLDGCEIKSQVTT